MKTKNAAANAGRIAAVISQRITVPTVAPKHTGRYRKQPFEIMLCNIIIIIIQIIVPFPDISIHIVYAQLVKFFLPIG
jgi:hypothetical protein